MDGTDGESSNVEVSSEGDVENVKLVDPYRNANGVNIRPKTECQEVEEGESELGQEIGGIPSESPDKKNDAEGRADADELLEESPVLKRKLESIEQELFESKEEVKKLKEDLDIAKKERQEILSTVSNMYVQIQYWNSWLGKLSANMSGKKDEVAPVQENCSEIISKVSKETQQDKAGDKVAIDWNKIMIGTEGGKNEESEGNKVADHNKDFNNKESDKTESSDSVADMLKETAEHAFASTGMSYDANTGLYYDWNAHMYYDPSTHLYYDNDNGIYYYYDNSKGSYVFYSQIDLGSPNEAGNASPQASQDKSEGELSSTEDEAEPEKVPCIRAIVTSSDVMKPGSLYLVTCNGAVLGRDRKHAFHIPDKNASKNHAEIVYDDKGNRYFIRDMGSNHGTYINDKKVSESKKASEWSPVNHKDYLKIGNTVFLIHLHRAQETCDHCEPGQVQAMLSAAATKAEEENTARLGKEQLRKKMLKGLKQKYSISGDGLREAMQPMESGKYKDRAITRRKKIGSVPIMNEKVRPESKASVTKMIPEENKGHKMMQKMGWKLGEGLGKQSSGITEPINVLIREKNKGLGTGVIKSIDDASGKPKNSKWQKAKQRYDNILKDETAVKAESQGSATFDF